jgi:hypothetical protein
MRFVHALAVVAGLFSEGTFDVADRRLNFAYSVSQTHSFTVRNDKLIDVEFTMVFHIPSGSTLTGSSKTILSDIGLQSIVGDVKATDASGRVLQTSMDDNGSWLRVTFDFAETIDGTTTPEYIVTLAYSVSNAICMISPGRARFDFPWAHRWVARVDESKYEIAFEDPDINLQTVCLGMTGFRSKCGSPALTVGGSSGFLAASSGWISGMYHGANFHWSANGNSFRSCEGSSEVQVSTDPPTAAVNTGNTMLPDADEGDSNVAMTLGVAAIGGGSLVFASLVCLCAHRAPVRGARRLQESDDERPATLPFPSKKKSDKLVLELDLEDTNSTVASVRELTIGGKRYSVDPSASLQPPAAQDYNLSHGTARRDTGGGLGNWNVETEFEQEELAELHSERLHEYSIQVSEHSPATRNGRFIDTAVSYGKPSSQRSHDTDPLSPKSIRREKSAKSMKAIELDVAEDFKEPTSPGRLLVEEGPLRRTGAIEAREAALAAEPPSMSRSWESGDFNGEDCPPPIPFPAELLHEDGRGKPKKKKSSRKTGHSEVTMSSASSRGPTSWEAPDEFDVEDLQDHAMANRTTQAMSAPIASAPSSSPRSQGGWAASAEFEDEDVIAHGFMLQSSEQPTKMSEQADAGFILQQNFLLPPMRNYVPAAPPAIGGASSLKVATLPSHSANETPNESQVFRSQFADQRTLPNPRLMPGTLPTTAGGLPFQATALPSRPSHF